MAKVLPPHELWAQADREHPADPGRRTMRYLELMVAAGHVVNRDDEEGTDEFGRQRLPCGHEFGSIDDLLTDEQKAALQADLDRMARQRRRAEAESRHMEMP